MRTSTHLDSFSVEADIPVGELFYELDESWHDSVEMVLRGAENQKRLLLLLLEPNNIIARPHNLFQ